MGLHRMKRVLVGIGIRIEIVKSFSIASSLVSSGFVEQIVIILKKSIFKSLLFWRAKVNDDRCEQNYLQKKNRFYMEEGEGTGFC